MVEEAKANGRENAFPDQRWKGLTKREWFAGMALQGLIACETVRGNAAEFAWWAVEHADAILSQLAESDGAK